MEIIKNYINKLMIKFIKNHNVDKHNGGRDSSFILTSIMALFSQMLQMLTPLITVRITLSYLGANIYAIWTTVNSLFSLMTYADMGLGNGLQTKLSFEVGKGNSNQCKKIVSSTYFILTMISIIICVIFVCVFPNVNWINVVGTDGSSNSNLTNIIVFVLVIPKIISIPLSLIRRCQNSMQEGYVGYFWQGITSIISLLSVYLTILFDLGPVNVILIHSIIPLIIYIINSIFYFNKKKSIAPRFSSVDYKLSIEMIKMGFGFFILSILNMLSLNMDNYIIARANKLDFVTPFSIALRVSQVLNVACSILSTPLWAANGDAFAKGEISWIKKTTKKVSVFSVVLVLSISTVIIIFCPYLFEWWLGYDIGIKRDLMFWLLLMQLSFAFISPYFMVLNAKGDISIQIIVFLIFTPISLLIKYYSCLYNGIVSMSACNVFLYIIFVVIPILIIVKKKYFSNI